MGSKVRIAIGLLSLFTLVACDKPKTVEQTPTAAAISNPLVRQRADTQIYRHSDGTYILAATVPEYDRLVLRHADTIAGLATAPETVIWRRHPEGEMAAHIWAPEIHQIDGKWYVYFAAGRSDDVWAIRVYVLENAGADPLGGEWVEKGQLKMAFESFTLDATTFVHRGQRYLLWAQRPDGLKLSGGGTGIYIARMKDPWTLEGPQVQISFPTYDWETIGFKVNEGPAAIVRNGRVFISYSASATDANYCMGLLSAPEDADLLDASSWTKSAVPVFTSNERNSQFGPGHNSFTLAEDGKTDVLVYHARNYKEIDGDPLNDPNRHTRVQRLNWKPDGTPDFGEPAPDGPVVLTAAADSGS